jgi:hypothetical protein
LFSHKSLLQTFSDFPDGGKFVPRHMLLAQQFFQFGNFQGLTLCLLIWLPMAIAAIKCNFLSNKSYYDAEKPLW